MPASWLIDKDDPARTDIVARAQALGITGTPDKAAHALGPVTLSDGTTVMAHVVHAVDPIITDGTDVVLINRMHDPGKGKPALPGGLIDPLKGGGIESAIQTAAREAMEEVGIDLDGYPANLIGTRNMNRPFDVRVAQNDGLEKSYGIRKGDVFMVSTQAVRFDVENLAQTTLVAGDDAEPGTARRVNIAALKKEDVGIPDHYDMIKAALPDQGAGQTTAPRQPQAAKPSLRR
jgi:8-oxo-dGTP pyrophosphatase MutT (NUDIX family)